MDAELNVYILNNEGKGLVPGYPQSMLDILGECNIAAVHGAAHKHMKGALLSIITPTMIKLHVLPKIDQFMRSHLSSWDHYNLIDIQQKTKEVHFSLSLLLTLYVCFVCLNIIFLGKQISTFLLTIGWSFSPFFPSSCLDGRHVS